MCGGITGCLVYENDGLMIGQEKVMSLIVLTSRESHPSRTKKEWLVALITARDLIITKKWSPHNKLNKYTMKLIIDINPHSIKYKQKSLTTHIHIIMISISQMQG